MRALNIALYKNPEYEAPMGTKLVRDSGAKVE